MTPEEYNRHLESSIPLAHGMGIRLVESSRGHAEAEIPMAGNGNHVGTMYAGALFTVAELLGGAIAISTFDTSVYYPIVKDLAITFRRPAMTTVRARATLPADTIDDVINRADEAGKADFVLEAELTDDAGVVVATTRGTYQIRRHTDPPRR
ncbi:MAG TPA: YiiD C-terminal domain-containing protein [Mycobacteriales bacterium]|nr:YiiD C-terminal domain-containing protein [Mycobacteriales bacterium]